MTSSDDDDTCAVVLDCGSGVCKAGFAGDKTARCFISSAADCRERDVADDDYRNRKYVGDPAIDHSAPITSPIQRGNIVDFDGFERLLKHVFSKELRIKPSEYPMLITENTLAPKVNREKIVQLMFERFNVPSLTIQNSALLALYSSGRTTGIVLDSGHGVTHGLPIYEGYPIHTGMFHQDIAGQDITNNLQKLLQLKGITCQTKEELDKITAIKEKHSRVLIHFESDIDVAAEHARQETIEESYPLDKELFLCCEALFQPHLTGSTENGIHHLINNSIMASPAEVRTHLYANIILSGGTTMTRGLPERVSKEIDLIAPCKHKVIAPPERKKSVWLGGSIVGDLSYNTWLSRAEYSDIGPTAIHKLCL